MHLSFSKHKLQLFLLNPTQFYFNSAPQTKNTQHSEWVLSISLRLIASEHEAHGHRFHTPCAQNRPWQHGFLRFSSPGRKANKQRRFIDVLFPVGGCSSAKYSTIYMDRTLQKIDPHPMFSPSTWFPHLHPHKWASQFCILCCAPTLQQLHVAPTTMHLVIFVLFPSFLLSLLAA